MSKKENLHCSVQRNKRRELENGKIDESCYNEEELRFIAEKLKLRIPATMKKMEIWKLVNEKMAQCSGREWCWANKLGLDNIVKNVFVPEGPNVGKAWLSNENIDAVLNQYVLAFPTYNYAGCFSIQVSSAAKKYKFDDPLEPTKLVALMKKFKYIGGVYNLDCFECPGTHWTNFMIYTPSSGVPEFRYYDSVGNNNTDNQVPAQVVELATNLGALVKGDRRGGKKNAAPNRALFQMPCKSKLHVVGKTGTGGRSKRGVSVIGAKYVGGEIVKGVNSGMIGGIRFMFNGKEHQRGDTECGVYSIHIQDLQINDTSFEKICQIHLPDETINTFRDIYFRPE